MQFDNFDHSIKSHPYNGMGWEITNDYQRNVDDVAEISDPPVFVSPVFAGVRVARVFLFHAYEQRGYDRLEAQEACRLDALQYFRKASLTDTAGLLAAGDIPQVPLRVADQNVKKITADAKHRTKGRDNQYWKAYVKLSSDQKHYDADNPEANSTVVSAELMRTFKVAAPCADWGREHDLARKYATAWMLHMATEADLSCLASAGRAVESTEHRKISSTLIEMKTAA